MKTYKLTIEKPQLEINYDEFAYNPRNDDNLSLLILKGVYGDNNTELKELLNTTANFAKNAQEHLILMKREIKRRYGKIVYANFISKYEHSGICLKIGNFKGFDYSMIGFVFITEKRLKEIGLSNTSNTCIEGIISDEINTYNQWLNGEVYQYILYDNQGTIVDSCTGFYDLESIKKDLPKEWQNEDLEQYIQY